MTKDMTQWKKKSLCRHLLAHGPQKLIHWRLIRMSVWWAPHTRESRPVQGTRALKRLLWTVFSRSWLTTGYAESEPAFRAAGTTTRNCCSKLSWKKRMTIRMAKCRFLFIFFFNGRQKIRLLKPSMHTPGEHSAALVLIKHFSWALPMLRRTTVKIAVHLFWNIFYSELTDVSNKPVPSGNLILLLVISCLQPKGAWIVTVQTLGAQLPSNNPAVQETHLALQDSSWPCPSWTLQDKHCLCLLPPKPGQRPQNKQKDVSLQQLFSRLKV